MPKKAIKHTTHQPNPAPPHLPNELIALIINHTINTTFPHYALTCSLIDNEIHWGRIARYRRTILGLALLSRQFLPQITQRHQELSHEFTLQAASAHAGQDAAERWRYYPPDSDGWAHAVPEPFALQRQWFDMETRRGMEIRMALGDVTERLVAARRVADEVVARKQRGALSLKRSAGESVLTDRSRHKHQHRSTKQAREKGQKPS